MDLIKKLEGKKTYIVAVIIAVVNLLAAFNVLDQEQIGAVNVILAALGLGTVRHAIKKGGRTEVSDENDRGGY